MSAPGRLSAQNSFECSQVGSQQGMFFLSPGGLSWIFLRAPLSFTLKITKRLLLAIFAHVKPNLNHNCVISKLFYLPNTLSDIFVQLTGI